MRKLQTMTAEQKTNLCVRDENCTKKDKDLIDSFAIN